MYHRKVAACTVIKHFNSNISAKISNCISVFNITSKDFFNAFHFSRTVQALNANYCAFVVRPAVVVKLFNSVTQFLTFVVNANNWESCCYICKFITELTGITNDMVKDAPVLDDVIDKFLEFVGNDIIVGYNNSSFDMCVLYDYILKLRGVFFSNNYEDVLHVARRSIKEISHYSLETLCNFWGFDNEGEHRALIDCYLTKKCYDKLYHEYGNEVFKNVRKTSEGKIEYASKTLALKELEIIIKYLLDESFDSDSIKIMKFWLNKHIDLENKYPFEELHNTINEYESNLDLCWAKNTIQKIMNPVESNCIKKEDNKNMSLDGKHICLTGNFEYGTKLDVEKFIVNKGGIIDKTVKKGTDYLIVGGDGNKNWTAENYGNKVKKALEFNKRGGNIMFINEADILPEPIRGRPGEMAIFLGI